MADLVGEPTVVVINVVEAWREEFLLPCIKIYINVTGLELRDLCHEIP